MNEFEGYIASEPLVPRTVHLSHAAGADLLQDPVSNGVFFAVVLVHRAA